MLENELMDVLSGTGKSGGESAPRDSRLPKSLYLRQLQRHPGGTWRSLLEADHAFTAYTARDMVPLENRSPTLESCRILHVHGFFAWPWAEGFFGPDAGKIPL